MRNLRKIIALALALIVMIVPINVKAAGSLDMDLVDEFTTQIFKTKYKEQVADLIQVLYDAKDREGLVTTYAEAFDVLAAKGQDGRVTDFGVTVQAMNSFVDLIDKNQDKISITNLITYIREGKVKDFENILVNHSKDILTFLNKADLTNDKLKSGFGKLETMIYLLESSKVIGSGQLFIYNTSSKNLDLNESKINTLIKLYNDKPNTTNPIEDVDNVNVALNRFVTYINASGQDKNIIINYLDDKSGLVTNYTPSDDGGSTGDGGSSSSGGGGGSSSGGGDIPSTGGGSELSDLIDDIKKEDKQEKAINKTEEALEDLSDKVASVKDEKSAYEAVKNVTATLKDVIKIVEVIENPADQKVVVEKVTCVLQNAVQALDMIDNDVAIKLKVEAMIKEVANLKVAAGKSLGNVTKIDQALVTLAEKAIEKAATIKAESFDLSKVDFKEQAAKATKVKAKMQKALKANKIKGNKALETKVTVEVPTASDAKEVEVTLPDLTEVFKSVDKVKVKSSVGSFELEAGTFGDNEVKDLKLSATIVDKTTLTASQMAKLPVDITNIIELNANVNGAQVSKFKKAIEVSVPYTLKKGENPNKISAYLLNDNGEIEKVAGKFNPLTGQITVMRKHFSKYFIAESKDAFSDIASYKWAKDEIETLAGKGIIGGIGNGKFDPSANISRASFVTLVVRMLQLDGDVSTLTFEDVSADAWYAKEVAAAVESGLINGRSATTFAPNDTITRQEVAVVISNAMNILGYTIEETPYIITNSVVDAADIAKWAKNATSTVYRDGVITGKPGNKFDPTGKATRAEAAVMMYRLYFGY